MSIEDEINLGNLFSLYKLVASKISEIRFVKKKEFCFIKSDHSIWPNAVFGLATEKITEAIIDEIVEVTTDCKIKPFIILKNEARSLSQIRKKGFLPIEQWVGMYYDKKFTQGLLLPDSTSVEILMLNNDDNFEEWTSLVSESLFNNKHLDASIFKKLRSNRVEFIVAKLVNKIIGTAMIYYDEKKIAGIYMVSVAKDYRNKGIAKKIMNFCFELIDKQGMGYCILQATKPGRPLYQSIGFKETGTYNLYMKIK